MSDGRARVAVLCPGRGSYTEKSLGSLPREHPWVQRADALRAELGLEPLSALDGAARFEPARHLRPAHVSALIYLVSMLEGTRVLERERVACVGGNSMGWYTALALAGALDFEQGFRLVQQMALLQEEVAGGGQVIYPLVDADWQPSAAQAASVRRALEGGGEDERAYPSIHLGGYEVLAGSSAAVARLLAELPPVQLGRTRYPFRLAQHGPYHTPLVAEVGARARARLDDLAFRRPRVTLVDGLGRRHTPWTADVAQLRAYTFGAQVDTPYDFTASVRVALLEHGPDQVVLPGPGNSLGGVVGQTFLALGWRGMRTRADFEAAQDAHRPPLVSLGR